LIIDFSKLVNSEVFINFQKSSKITEPIRIPKGKVVKLYFSVPLSSHKDKSDYFCIKSVSSSSGVNVHFGHIGQVYTTSLPILNNSTTQAISSDTFSDVQNVQVETFKTTQRFDNNKNIFEIKADKK
jgi:hypothetical protein